MFIASGSLSSLCSEMVTFCVKTRIWSFHSHILVMAQAVGFEPTVRSHASPVFKTGPLSHSGTLAYGTPGEIPPAWWRFTAVRKSDATSVSFPSFSRARLGLARSRRTNQAPDVFRLGEWSPRLPVRDCVPAVLWILAYASPKPRRPQNLRFGLIHVRSPLLAESPLISFPRPFGWFPSWPVTGHDSRVSSRERRFAFSRGRAAGRLGRS